MVLCFSGLFALLFLPSGFAFRCGPRSDAPATAGRRSETQLLATPEIRARRSACARSVANGRGPQSVVQRRGGGRRQKRNRPRGRKHRSNRRLRPAGQYAGPGRADRAQARHRRLANKISENCGLYMDPFSGDIYSVNGDTANYLTVWSHEQKGNSDPDRTIDTPHRGFRRRRRRRSQGAFPHDRASARGRGLSQGGQR